MDKVLDGVRISVTFENKDGYKTYSTTPVAENGELMEFMLRKFLKYWSKDKEFLKENPDVPQN